MTTQYERLDKLDADYDATDLNIISCDIAAGSVLPRLLNVTYFRNLKHYAGYFWHCSIDDINPEYLGRDESPEVFLDLVTGEFKFRNVDDLRMIVSLQYVLKHIVKTSPLFKKIRAMHYREFMDAKHHIDVRQGIKVIGTKGTVDNSKLANDCSHVLEAWV